MAGCCDQGGYDGVFGEREARRAIRSFEKKGLDSTAGPMVVALHAGGLGGVEVLEAGTGSGTALVSLLEAGASHAVGYDISPGYQAAAAALLESRGLEGRADLVVGDFVTATPPEAEVVFLNRVVCCYPDMDGLVDAAADATGGRLAMSFPRRNLFTRVALGVINAFMRLRRSTFRVYVHPPAAIRARAESAGLAPAAGGSTRMWEWQLWERTA